MAKEDLFQYLVNEGAAWDVEAAVVTAYNKAIDDCIAKFNGQGNLHDLIKQDLQSLKIPS